MLMRPVLVSAMIAVASGHASMSVPPPRQMHGKPIECYKKEGKDHCDAGCSVQSCLWYQVGCMVGCDTCSLEGKEMYPEPSHVQCTRNGTVVPAGREPYPVPRTLPAAARTWNIEGKSPMGDFTAYMPWSSPGASHLVDSCGVASGFGSNAPAYVKAPDGYKPGDKGSEVLTATANKTVVRAGGLLETGFGFQVNHGGGYAYRLCPAGSALTEECFQAHHLEFATSDHTIKYVDKSKADVVLPAMTISTGTTPNGAQWRRVPLPACNCDLGEGCFAKKDDKETELAAMVEAAAALFESPNKKCTADPTCSGKASCKKCDEEEGCVECCDGCTTKKWGSYSYCYCGGKGKGEAQQAYEVQADAPPRCPTGTQFPVPHEDLYGYGDVPDVLITDVVRVPEGLPAGDYVLSWRWDCEQTPQIWSSCADLTVVAA